MKIDKITELRPQDLITIEMLTERGACAEGMAWVKANLPDGAPYQSFLEALEADSKYDWASWLIFHFGAAVLAANWRVPQIISATKKIVSSGDSAQIGSSGDSAQIGSSGNYAQIGSSGNYAQIGSSGDYARIGSSGNYARIGSSGDSAQIGSSGNYARIGSSGNSARIGSSGNSAQIEATGKNSILACVGENCIAKSAEGGCIALRYTDASGRARLAVGYVGEDIEADSWYRAGKEGKLEKVEGSDSSAQETSR